jgi:hypothetical protein
MVKKAREALLPRIKKIHVRKEKRAVILLERATIHIDMRILREYSRNQPCVLRDCSQKWVLSPCFGVLRESEQLPPPWSSPWDLLSVADKST